MVRSRWVMGFTLVALATATAAWPQNGAAPTAPPAAAVKLAYHFRPGAVSRQRFNSSGTIIVDLNRLPGAGQGGIPSSLTADVSTQYDILQTVKSVGPDGSATLAFSLDNLTFNAKLMGSTVAARFLNGKLTFTRDGERFTPPGVGSGNPFAGKKFEARVAATGQLLERHGSLSDTMQKVFAGDAEMQMFQLAFLVPEVELLILPPAAVAVGQTWDEPDPVVPDAVRRGGKDPGHPLAKDVKVVYTLKELQQRGARQIAVIELKAEGSEKGAADGRIAGAGEQEVRGLTMLVTGSHLFDVAAGELRMAEFALKMSGEEAAQEPGAAPIGVMGVDASLDTKIAVQPVTASRSPAPTATKRRPRGK